MKSFDDMVKELFELSLEAQQKTNAYVSFNVSNNRSLSCVVTIMDNGFDKDKISDGFYIIVFDEDHEEHQITASDHAVAVDHLKRLIREAYKAKSNAVMDARIDGRPSGM